MSLTIRPYAPDDWPRLCAVHDAARPDELRAADLADAFLTLEQTADGEGLFDGRVDVAEVDGEVQGFVAAANGELTWLYVHPTMYRRGVGRALVRHVLEGTGGAMTTEVLVGNDAALALYLAEGFEITARNDGRLVGNESFAASAYLLERPGAPRREGRAP